MNVPTTCHFVLIILCFWNAAAVVGAEKLQIYGDVPGLDSSPYYKIQVRQGGKDYLH